MSLPTKKSDSHVIVSVSTPVNLHIVIELCIEYCNEHAHILSVDAWNQHCRDACKVSERCDHYQISRLRDFPRFGGKMSTRLVNRGPAYVSANIRFILHFVKFVYVSMSQRVEILPRFPLDGWDPFCCIFNTMAAEGLPTHGVRPSAAVVWTLLFRE